MLSFHYKDKIKNVVIFVCDALRYDYTPDIISNMGIKAKMIASSNFTAPTFPSIISGLYPFNHNIVILDYLIFPFRLALHLKSVLHLKSSILLLK